MGHDSPTASPSSSRVNPSANVLKLSQNPISLCKNKFKKNRLIRAWDGGGKAKGDRPRLRLTHQSGEMMKEQDVDQLAVEGSKYPHRIINTHTLEFETDCTFFKDNYATFSHTWTQEGAEVDFPDGVKLLARANSVRIAKGLWAQEKQWKMSGSSLRGVQLRSAEAHRALTFPKDYSVRASEEENPAHETIPNLTLEEAKLLRAVKAARELGFKYLWVDNCCIDKEDNMELTEALSSMGQWYTNAAMCLVYLEDCTKTSVHFKNDASEGLSASGYNYRWSTRGWTLQEIVMSRRATFYNKYWERILDTAEHLMPGIKDTDVLNSTLSNLCRVPPQLICYGRKPNIPAAVLMSMASKRNTTRVEDGVYSLLGMLGVRMEADYGEGLTRAVERLFDKLIESGMADASMFNWLGQSRGNTLPGRSMYPIDLEGYDTPGSIIIEAADFDPAPFHLPSSVTLGPSGIEACFDIYPIPMSSMKFGQTQTMAADHENPTYNPLVRSSCRILLHTDLVLKVDLSCPLSILNHLETTDSTNHPSVRWLLAKFSHAPGADWFLSCTQSTLRSVADTGGRGGQQNRVVDGIGGMGVEALHARRIATNGFIQVQGTSERKLTARAFNELVMEYEYRQIKALNMVME